MACALRTSSGDTCWEGRQWQAVAVCLLVVITHGFPAYEPLVRFGVSCSMRCGTALQTCQQSMHSMHSRWPAHLAEADVADLALLNQLLHL